MKPEVRAQKIVSQVAVKTDDAELASKPLAEVTLGDLVAAANAKGLRLQVKLRRKGGTGNE